MQMGEQLYSAEEAAQILGLQVRTVRNYIREGRLPGVRIGKQYRITRGDLEAFTGAFGGGGATRMQSGAGESAQPAPTGGPQGVARAQPAAQPSRTNVEVSSVVQVDGVDAAWADRIIRTLTAATAGRSATDAALRVEPLYDDERRRFKAVIVGPVVDSLELIRIVDALARPDGRLPA